MFRLTMVKDSLNIKLKEDTPKNNSKDFACCTIDNNSSIQEKLIRYSNLNSIEIREVCYYLKSRH